MRCSSERALQRRIEHLHVLKAFLFHLDIVHAGEARETFAGHLALLKRMYAPTSEAPALIDKQVVHDPTQPRAGFVNGDKVVEFAVGLDEKFLEQVFGLGLGAGQPPRETVQPVEVRSYY